MAYTAGTNAIKEHQYKVWIMIQTYTGCTPDDELSDASVTTKALLETELGNNWQELGRLEEKPTFTTEDGTVINIDTGHEILASEMVSIDLKDLQVTKDNYDTLMSTYHKVNCALVFYDCSESTATVYEILDMNLRTQLTVTGNDFNRVLITGKKKVSDVTSLIKVFELS